MMKWFEYKEIGIGISIDIDYINSLSDIVDLFSISESASVTGFRSRYSVSVSASVPVPTISSPYHLSSSTQGRSGTSLIQMQLK
jgi:hypothetical protein